MGTWEFYRKLHLNQPINMIDVWSKSKWHNKNTWIDWETELVLKSTYEFTFFMPVISFYTPWIHQRFSYILNWYRKRPMTWNKSITIGSTVTFVAVIVKFSNPCISQQLVNKYVVDQKLWHKMHKKWIEISKNITAFPIIFRARH